MNPFANGIIKYAEEKEEHYKSHDEMMETDPRYRKGYENLSYTPQMLGGASVGMKGLGAGLGLGAMLGGGAGLLYNLYNKGFVDLPDLDINDLRGSSKLQDEAMGKNVAKMAPWLLGGAGLGALLGGGLGAYGGTALASEMQKQDYREGYGKKPTGAVPGIAGAMMGAPVGQASVGSPLLGALTGYYTGRYTGRKL